MVTSQVKPSKVSNCPASGALDPPEVFVFGLGRLAHGLQVSDLAASATLLSLLWTLWLDMSSLPAAVADDFALAFAVGAATFLAVTSTRAVIVAASTAAAAATAAAATSSRKPVALAISP